MDTKTESKLIVSDQDYKSLTSLASSGNSEVMIQLEEELSKASVLPKEQLPEDVVAMHSTVEIVDLDTGSESRLTLVYPNEADVKSNKVSILAPMGIALIGLREGQSAEWPMPGGRQKHFRIKAVEREKAA